MQQRAPATSAGWGHSPPKASRLHLARVTAAHATAIPLTKPVHSEAERAQSATPQPCVRQATAGRPLYRVKNGTHILPLVQPTVDGVPFAVALELVSTREGSGEPEASVISAKASSLSQSQYLSSEEEGCFTLRYVLDGAIQCGEASSAPDTLQAGDSIISLLRAQSEPPTVSAARASSASADTADGLNLAHELRPSALPRSDSTSAATSLAPSAHYENEPRHVHDQNSLRQWQAASLLFLLPAGDYQANATLLDAAHAWRSDTLADSLAPSELSSIFAGARRCADLAFAGNPHEPTHKASRTPHTPQASETQPRMSPSLVQHLRRLPEGFIRGLMERFVRAKQPHAASHQAASVSHSADDSLKAGGTLWRAMRDLVAMRLPNQSNRLALVFDPLNDPVPFTFGVEIFEPEHRTTPHTHAVAHELFFILAGHGEGFCDGKRFALQAGDVVVFPPRTVHGIDNGALGRMYCLELMLPNDMFAEMVKAGTPTGGLADEDLCVLIAAGCGSA